MSESSVQNPHLVMPLTTFGRPLAEARAAVILVHGRGQSPQVMHDLVVNRFGANDFAWVSPLAAEGAWYPERFLEPVKKNEPWLGFALDRLEVISDQLAKSGIPYEQQVFMGFSQGACLCCEFVWRSQRRYKALVAFTGALIGPEGLARQTFNQHIEGMPVLLSTWANDPWVPIEYVRKSAELFRHIGADVSLKVEDAIEHGILDCELANAQAICADCVSIGEWHE